MSKSKSQAPAQPQDFAAQNAADINTTAPAQSPQPQPDPAAQSSPDVKDAKIAELINDLQRTRADFENFRKQVDLQKSQAMSAACYATVEKFLPLLDDIDRAIAAYPDQLKPLEKNLSKLLQSLKLQKVASDPGVEFNPDYHDAVSVVDNGGDTEVILETLRPGYLYEGIVLRPAMVKVAK